MPVVVVQIITVIKRNIATVAPIMLIELKLVIIGVSVILAVSDGNMEESLFDCCSSGITVDMVTVDKASIMIELKLVIVEISVIMVVSDGNTEESLLDCGVTVELLTLTET